MDFSFANRIALNCSFACTSQHKDNLRKLFHPSLYIIYPIIMLQYNINVNLNKAILI